MRAIIFSLVGLVCVGCASNAPQPSSSFFPITPWELPPRTNNFKDPVIGLKSIKEAGYTVAAFARPSDLPQCQKLGLRAIVVPEDWEKLDWKNASDDQIAKYVHEMVDPSHDSSCVMGYFLTDEPGIQKFPGLAKAVALVKKLAPGKLAYINLYPDYATLGNPDMSQLGTPSFTDYLEKYIQIVHPQFLSYDNYRVEQSMDGQNHALIADYFGNLLEVRRVALKHNLPFWNIVSSNQIRPFTTTPSPANLLFQANTTLAAGAKGLTWFTYYSTSYGYAPVDKEHHRAFTWTYLKMVNDQVKVIGPIIAKLKSTGVYFTSPAPIADAKMLPGNVVTQANCDVPLMIGEFEDSTGGKYAMIVNTSLQKSAKFQLNLATPGLAEYYSPVDAALISLEKDNSLWLAAGQGVLIKTSH